MQCLAFFFGYSFTSCALDYILFFSGRRKLVLLTSLKPLSLDISPPKKSTTTYRPQKYIHSAIFHDASILKLTII